MRVRRTRRRWWIAGTGFAVGLALGIGMLLGNLLGGRDAAPRPEIPLHALATHGTDTMAICTMPIEDGVEGLATLDFMTGELRVFVMNNRSYTFTLVGKYNVLADLKVDRTKKINLLMVSGQTTFIRGGAAANPANSTIYVCDANSGAFVAYGMLYPRTALAAAAPAAIEIRRLDIGVSRNIVVDAP
jgi:hypothetical protein